MGSKNSKFDKSISIFRISAFFTQKSCIIWIFHFSFTKPRKDPHKLKIRKNNGHIRNLLIFLPRNDVSHVFLTYLSLKFEKVGKTQQKFKIPWQTSQIRIPRGRFGGSQSWNIDISTNSEFYVNQWKSMKEFYKRRSSEVAANCR